MSKNHKVFVGVGSSLAIDKGTNISGIKAAQLSETAILSIKYPN